MVYGPAAPKGSRVEGGRTIVPRKFQGPTRPGTDVEKFRGTGRSVSSGRTVGPTRKEFEVAKKAASDKAATEAAARKAVEATKQKAAELKRIELAKSFAEKTRIAKEIVLSRQAQAQFQKILNFKSTLINRGVTEQASSSKDSKTGDKLEISRWRDKVGNMVQRIVNKNDGTTEYSSFSRIKGNGVRKIGEVVIGGTATLQDVANKVKIIKSDNPSKLIVTLPSGKKGTINASGRVVVGKNLAGNQLVFQDGVLRQIDGIDLYEEALKPVEIVKHDKIVNIKKIKNISKKWEQDIATTKGILTNANQRGDMDKLRELQRIGNNRTPSQNTEYNKLSKETAKNYELGGEMIGKTIGSSLINMGVGSAELLALLKENPKETLVALPPLILAGVKQDFNRVMSGDPLEIGQVGLEYYTFAKLFQLTGRGLSAGAKASYGVGRTLAPKYIGLVANKLAVAPARITGAAIRTGTGRKAVVLINKALKKPGVSANIIAFNKKLKIKKSSIDGKISSIQRRVVSVKAGAKGKIAVARKNIQYKEALKQAKKARIRANKKGKTLPLTSPNYKQALRNINTLSDSIAEVKTYEFLNNFVKKGGKVTKKQTDDLLDAVKIQYRNRLDGTLDYQTLIRLSKQDRFLSVKLIKQGKIKSARILLNKLVKKIQAIPVVKFIGRNLSSIKRGVKVRVARVTKDVARVKQKVKVKKELKVEKRVARKSRIKAGKKKKTVVIGNSDFGKALNFVERFGDNYAKVKAKRIINQIKKSGQKVGLGMEEEFIKRMQVYVRKQLNTIPEFKKLKQTAKLNKPIVIEFVKKGKVKSARLFIKNLRNKIVKLPISRRVRIISSKIKKATSPKSIKKKFKRAREVREAKKFRKQTIRYQMEKARPLREVTLEQFRRSSDVSKMNKFIDSFFDQMGRKQKIDISVVKYKQMKNLMKKRMAKAIKNGDRLEINNFGVAVRKLISDMKKKSSNPDIKITEVVNKKKVIRTIKDFDIPKPKGTYVEVKSGGQILLQKVKTKQVSKVKQKAKILSVQKKKLNLRPLLQFGVKSLSAVAVKNMLKSKQAMGRVTNQASLTKVLQDSAQDFKVLTIVSQGILPKEKIATAIATAVNSKIKIRPRTKAIQKSKKKKVVIKIKQEKKKTRKLSKKALAFNVVVKSRGKMVTLKLPPMLLKDAEDVASSRIDKGLIRTAKLVPVGMVNEVAIVSKSVKGYYKKFGKKFRTFRVKKGKKISLTRTIIENKKYVGDLPSERRQLRAAKKRAKPKQKKKVVKKKVVKKKTAKKKKFK